MGDGYIKDYPKLDMKYLKEGFSEELDFVLTSIDTMTEDERNFVAEYMLRYMDQVALGEENQQEIFHKQDITAYKDKIRSIKEEIKYLKKLKKKKEELEEKEIKRYKALRELYKEGQLDTKREEEYRELRKKFKNRKRI